MASIYDQSPLLPEIIRHIAATSPITWTQIATAIPDFGRWSMTRDGRLEFARLFIRLHKYVSGLTLYTITIYGGAVRSVYDWPSVVGSELDGDITLADFIDETINPSIIVRHWTSPVSTSIATMSHIYAHRVSGPATVYANGTRVWYRHGQRHREDGPAMVHYDGCEVWYCDGAIHRIGGPAVKCHDGRMEWWEHGVRLKRSGF